jgi:sulfur transfer protein SufE
LVRGLSPSRLRSIRTTPFAKSCLPTPQAFFRELGLEQHLTPQQFNGVRAMIAALWVGRFLQERFGNS